MHRPYMKPVAKALPDVQLPEPRISKFVLCCLRILVRFYLFLFYGVARVVLRGEQDLFGAFKRALGGESRCIIAFRHPNGGEPQLLAWFFLFKLRRLAARAGVRFARFPHAVFVYGYEVVRWGGPVARYVLPNVGAMPIHHAKLDREGMNRIYTALTGGPWPLALAPEGQTSYTTESVPRLEPGVIRIGFHAAERLVSGGSPVPVEILPVAVHFRFGSWGRLTVENLIRKIEKYTGAGNRKKQPSFSKRLRAARDHILEVNEKRYGIAPDPDLAFEDRMDAVINAALETSERILGIKAPGDVFARLYSLRQTCWDRMILPGMDAAALDGLTGVERAVTDLQAGEAWHASRHLEVVDFSWYFRVPVPSDDAFLHDKIEYTQNLWDFANRTMGGAYADRISIFPRRVIIQAAPVINLTERLPGYREDRKSAVNTALLDLKDAFLECIERLNKAE
ncbi:MAG: acyltransferase [Treponema sp.]|nr:acyltransferase [Treponema sp.]